ncbi:hypothetical protein EIP91_007561 [Steccherinum ochraceum]|uniref:TLC domain-containing protein n=1 Tax=Steccherinum ochraceum TaxID=92696 RepID=A0A4R0RP30_9APHY|nr:hypothetical protein EIP91_007561 [Steccherinum ochraceum]
MDLSWDEPTFMNFTGPIISETSSAPRSQWHSNDVSAIFFSCAVVFHLVDKSCRLAVRHYFPRVYQELKSRNTTGPFFCFALASLVSLLTTPLCYHAFTILPDKSTLNFAHPGLAELCVGIRSFSWMHEMSGLELGTTLFLHHTTCLWVVISAAGLHLPGAKYLCLIIASCGVELATNTSAMLSYCGYKARENRLVWWLECINVASTFLGRAPAVYLALVSPWHRGLPWRHQAAWGIPVVLYAVYQSYVLYRRLVRMGVWHKVVGAVKTKE